MDMRGYIDEIKLSLTGGVLDLEIDDKTIESIVNAALRQTQRYICSTKIITIPYEKCINLKDYKINAIARVYKAQGNVPVSSVNSTTDPIQVGLWQLTSNTGNMYNFSDYINRYASWSTLQQISNTLTTDLDWYYQDDKNTIYINTALDTNTEITIEYIPRYDSVEEVNSDFWIDVIMRMAKAQCKITLGRIRSRFTQANALWTQDGETILNEGKQEMTDLVNYLQENTQLLYARD